MQEILREAASGPEMAVGIASLLAFGLVFFLALGASLLHAGLALVRPLFGRRAGWDLWTLAYFGPLVVVLLAVIPLSFVEALQTETMGQTAGLVIMLAVIAPPVFVPILRAYVQRRVTTLTYLHTLAALLALPIAMTFLTLMLAIVDSGMTTGNALTPDVFVLQTDFAPCQAAMVRMFGLTVPADFNDLQANELVFLMQFWVDATLKAIFFDAFEVYGCSVATVTHRTDNVLMASLVFGYRTFVAAAVLAILLLPFRRRAA